MSELWKLSGVGAQILEQAYKSLSPVVIISTILVNTHTQTAIGWLHTISSVPAQLKKLTETV